MLTSVPNSEKNNVSMLLQIQTKCYILTVLKPTYRKPGIIMEINFNMKSSSQKMVLKLMNFTQDFNYGVTNIKIIMYQSCCIQSITSPLGPDGKAG